MPLFKLETTVALSDLKEKAVLAALPEACKLLKYPLGIAPDRVYLNLTGVEAGSWGWNGSALG